MKVSFPVGTMPVVDAQPARASKAIKVRFFNLFNQEGDGHTFYVLRREIHKVIYEYRRMLRRPIPSPSVFGVRLRQARLRLELAQDKLGTLAGLDESSSSARISRYESGIHEPSVQFAEALAKVLGVSAAFFYCRDDRLAEIILLYADMSETKRRTLHDTARGLIK